MPLHTLRKMFGSQVCAKHGIYAASHALRHADIAITSQPYLDKRKIATAGLGYLLRRNGKIIEPPRPRAVNKRIRKRSRARS